MNHGHIQTHNFGLTVYSNPPTHTYTANTTYKSLDVPFNHGEVKCYGYFTHQMQLKSQKGGRNWWKWENGPHYRQGLEGGDNIYDGTHTHSHTIHTHMHMYMHTQSASHTRTTCTHTHSLPPSHAKLNASSMQNTVWPQYTTRWMELTTRSQMSISYPIYACTYPFKFSKTWRGH